jgi:hypothetical protein
MAIKVKREDTTSRYWSGDGEGTQLLYNSLTKDIQITFNIT